MAVSGSRKRAANVGHHHTGSSVDEADGTKSFMQSVAIGDPTNTDAQAGLVTELNREGYLVPVTDPKLETIIDALEAIRDELQITNFLLKGLAE